MKTKRKRLSKTIATNIFLFGLSILILGGLYSVYSFTLTNVMGQGSATFSDAEARQKVEEIFDGVMGACHFCEPINPFR